MKRRLLAGVGAVGLVAAGVLVGTALDDDASPAAAAPNATDVGFAYDMAVHHEQAVDMAGRIRMRTDDEALRLMTMDMELTQQHQIGRMKGWLDEWELTGRRPVSMAWMGMAGIPMPGLAGTDDVESLSTRPVDEAEVRFLELMIVHHRAGVDMAEAALAQASQPAVIRLAEAIVASQNAEIEVLSAELTSRGGTVPLDADADAGSGDDGMDSDHRGG